MDALKHSVFVRLPKTLVAGLGIGLISLNGPAATIVWSGGSGTDTNWSNGNNWNGAAAPGGGDDVKFFDAGSNLTQGLPNSLVDASFAGYVGSLQLGNSNGLHTIVIAAGASLSLTNGNLSVGTPGDPGAAKNFTNTITGAGAALYVSNTNANISINQAGANGANRAGLDLSGLDNFIVTANRLGIGDGQFPGVSVNNKVGGCLILAKTNVITLGYADTLANYQVANKSSAIILSRNSGNNPALASILELGISNVFNVDSINCGMDKSGNNSTSAHGIIQFNPAFAGQNQIANFYGAGGAGTRVNWWSAGDGNISASTSNGGGGTNDFRLGTVNAWVNVMSLARDASSGSDTWVGPHKGVFIFTNGTVDVNVLYVGNQYLETGTSTTPSLGIFNVAGAGALLRVNTNLWLGRTTLTTAAGTGTAGILNVTNGAVYANNITVGTNSVTNIINLVNGTLIVSNTLATNASGLFTLNISNSTLGLPVATNGSLFGLVQTLNSTGATNLIQLPAGPVIFATYPQQFPLLRYTAWKGSNTFGLTGIPAWAPGATLVSNGPNKTLDLSLPTDPRPVFTAQPTPYSGAPGDNVTTNFSVAISAGSVTPVSYQWYFVSGNVTNALTDGTGPSGTSTLTGAATANLQIASAQTGDSGIYFVVAANAYGTNSSSLALLTISASAVAPAISGPAAVTATNGVATTIANVVSGSPVPQLYWQYNGASLADGAGPSGVSVISGSSGATLAISNPQYPLDQGTYSLIASNSAGLATNNTVLTVIVAPVITNQPGSLVVTNTQTAAFTVVAGGVPKPTYQWYKGSIASPISSAANATATNATLVISSATSADLGTYFVVVQNAAGAVTSGNAALTVNSTMKAIAFTPANQAAGVCYDTPLYVTFSQAPTVRAAGKISIFNLTNSATAVDVIDLSQGTLQTRTIAGESFATYPVIVTSNTAAIYPHLGLLTSNQTYYVMIDDGVFADATGAYYAGITAASTWQFATKTAGPANPASVTVAQDYSGDFATVQGALDSLPASNLATAMVNVRDGLYTEIVEFKKTNVVLRGESRAGTIIGYANNSVLNASTHSRMAMKVNASYVALDNLTITNSTAQDYSQAEALMLESGVNQVIVNNCNVDSYQDTILANISTTKAYFNNSLIQGDVDFIWGGGNLFFTNCEILYLIRSNNAAALGPNPSPGATDISSNGFSFVNCAFVTLPGANPNDTIGRTRSITNGNTALINCLVSTNIGGWSSDALPTASFRNWYYGCTNDLGVAVTLSNGLALSASDPNLALAGSSATWLYGWAPALPPNIISQPAGQTVTAGQPASFMVAATGLPAPSYQWLFNGVPIPDATNALYAVASAVRTNGGNYSVAVSNGAGSVTSSVAVLVYSNTPPVAGAASYVRNVAVTELKINIANLLTNVTDVDGDSLTLAAVGVSTNGVTPVISGGNIVYDNVNAVADQFSYTVGDGFGGTSTGGITVNVSSLPLFGLGTIPIAVTAGSASLNFVGFPGYSYSVLRSTNVDFSAFDVVWTTNAPDGGGFLFVDPNPPQSAVFYRLLLNE